MSSDTTTRAAAAQHEEAANTRLPQSMVFFSIPGGGPTGDPADFETAMIALIKIDDVPLQRPDLEPMKAAMKQFTPEMVKLVIIDDVQRRVRSSAFQERVAAFFAKHPPLAHLSEDEMCAIAAYTLEESAGVSPYKILNAWLQSDRRTPHAVAAVGPFFVLLYRALEKLPRFVVTANRGVQCREIKSLLDTYDNYKERCKPGNDLAFWGIASFSTKDDVAGDPYFVGQPGEKGIVYSVGELECVNIAPFSLMSGGAGADGEGEAEVIPLPPLLLKAQTSFMTPGRKLVIACQHVRDECSYVVQRFKGTQQQQQQPHVVQQPVLKVVEKEEEDEHPQQQQQQHHDHHNPQVSAAAAATATSSSDPLDSITLDQVNGCVTDKALHHLLKPKLDEEVLKILLNLKLMGKQFLAMDFDNIFDANTVSRHHLKKSKLASLRRLHERLNNKTQSSQQHQQQQHQQQHQQHHHHPAAEEVVRLEKRLKEIDGYIRDTHKELEFAIETFSPDARKHSEAKKELVELRQEVEEELAMLKREQSQQQQPSSSSGDPFRAAPAAQSAAPAAAASSSLPPPHSLPPPPPPPDSDPLNSLTVHHFHSCEWPGQLVQVLAVFRTIDNQVLQALSGLTGKQFLTSPFEKIFSPSVMSQQRINNQMLASLRHLHERVRKEEAELENINSNKGGGGGGGKQDKKSNKNLASRRLAAISADGVRACNGRQELRALLAGAIDDKVLDFLFRHSGGHVSNGDEFLKLDLKLTFTDIVKSQNGINNQMLRPLDALMSRLNNRPQSHAFGQPPPAQSSAEECCDCCEVQ